MSTDIVPVEEEEEDACKLCNVLVPLTEQHFIRLTAPTLTRAFLLCADCWTSFWHELTGGWEAQEIIDARVVRFQTTRPDDPRNVREIP